MTRTMYDSTNMAAIPADAEIVAGYPYAFPVDFSAFPHALQVWIDQHGNHPDTCHVADYENGAIGTPQAIRNWVIAWHGLHPVGLAAVNGFFDVPTVYSDLNNLKTVMQALSGLVYDIWVARWDSGTAPVPGTSLLQYASPSSTPPSGGDYDISAVYDDTWGVRQAPRWELLAVRDMDAAIASANAAVALLRKNL